MSAPKISVIVPVYNKAAYLASCIDSILTQSFMDLELILVDDQSTDASFDVCRRFAAFDSRIRLIQLPENVGAGRARNAGLDAALGECISFVDADDRLDREMLSKLYAALTERGADAAICGFAYETLKGKLLASFSNPPSGRILEGGACLNELVRLYPVSERFDISLCNKLYRRELIGDTRLESICSEDYLFNCAVFSRAKRVAQIQDVLYYAILTENSFSRSALNEKNITALEANRRALDFLRQSRPALVPLGLERLITACGNMSLAALKSTALPRREAMKQILSYARPALSEAKRFPNTEASRAARRQWINIFFPRLNPLINAIYTRFIHVK